MCARFPFVCDGGCQSRGGSYPEGTLRYAVYDSARIDPRPARGGASQPWAQYCVRCFDMRDDVQAYMSDLMQMDTDAAAGAVAEQGVADTSEEQLAAAATVTGVAAATEDGCDEGSIATIARTDWDLADDEAPPSLIVTTNKEQRAYAMVLLLCVLCSVCCDVVLCALLGISRWWRALAGQDLHLREAAPARPCARLLQACAGE